MQAMTAVLIVTDGTSRDVRPFGKFFLSPAQKTTGGPALFGRQYQHPDCSRPRNSTLFMQGEGTVILSRAQESQAGYSVILLSGVFAPTDPVLASDGPMAPPGMGLKDEMRFILTAETGLNDGLACPFVDFAIVVALAARRDLPGCSSSRRLM
jgi:hypothetical protein